MKPSYYNVLVDIDDTCSVLYNTLTQALLELDSSEADAYRGTCDNPHAVSANTALKFAPPQSLASS